MRHAEEVGPGKARPALFGRGDQHGERDCLDDDLESGERIIRVPVGTLDGEIDARGKLVVAKIDVEGGELGAVRGMERLVRENRVILQIERNKGPLSDLVELLAGFGVAYERTIGIDHYFLKL